MGHLWAIQWGIKTALNGPVCILLRAFWVSAEKKVRGPETVKSRVRERIALILPYFLHLETKISCGPRTPQNNKEGV